MTDAEIRKLAAELLSDIAPETDPEALPGDRDIREELDIDSMDFLNFIVALAKQTELAIPEEDYPRLFTMDGIAAYVAEKS